MKNEADFRNFMQDKVVGPFKKWAEQFRSKQFAVMLLMDSDSNWNQFQYDPPLNNPSVNKEREWPADGKIVNYYAALPKNHKHSEARILDNFEILLKNYINKKHAKPKAIVLYTWYKPCSHYHPKHTNCMTLLTQFAEALPKMGLDGVKMIVAYTEEYKNLRAREEALKEEVVKIPYSGRVESLINMLAELVE